MGAGEAGYEGAGTEGGSFLDTTKWNQSFKMELLADGEEAEVRVAAAATQPKKEGGGVVLALQLVCTNPRVDDIYHYTRLPDDELMAEDMKAWNKAVNRLERIADCFGVEHEGQLVFTDFNGKSGWIIARLEDSDRGKRNAVREFVVGR